MGAVRDYNSAAEQNAEVQLVQPTGADEWVKIGCAS